MGRLCERPGCSAPADVAYGFDADLLTVWLDAFHTAQGARSGVLCRRHADAMIVPLGWMLDDRREPVPRLFKSPGEPVPSRQRRQRSARRNDSEQLSLDSATTAPDETPAEDTMAEELAVEHEVAPWQPVFDQTDDLHGLLNARGRLLSRAFKGAPPVER